MEEAKNYSLNKKALFILILILILGSFLRLYNLGKESLWCDEFLSLGASSFSNISDVIFKKFYGHVDVFPPAYQILLHFLIKYIGNSEFILRLPSCIFGILSVYVTFLLGRYLYTYREGLIAASFMAVLHSPIQYSQEVRPYSMLLFFSLISIYFWVKLMRVVNNDQKPSYYLLFSYTTLAVIASYTHYFGFYFIMLQVVSLFLFSIRRTKAFPSIFFICLFVSLSYLPWIIIIGKSHFVQVCKIWGNVDTFKLKSPLILLNKYLYWFFTLNRSLLLKRFVVTIYALMFFRYLYYFFNPKIRKERYLRYLKSTLLIISWIVIPLIVWVLISFIRVEMVIAVTSRNFLIFLPFICLLIAHSLMQLPLKMYQKLFITILLFGFMLYQLFFVFQYYSSYHKQQFREVVNEIIINDNKYNDTLIISWGGIPIFFEYYFKKAKFNKHIDFAGYRKNNMAYRKPNLKDVKNIIATENKRYVWVCVYKEFDSSLQNFLKENYKVIDSKIFSETSVWLFEKKDI